MWIRCLDTGFVVCGEKDCFKFGTDIGTWRLEEKKTITLPTQLYTYKFNEVPEIPKINNVKVEVEDEWRY